MPEAFGNLFKIKPFNNLFSFVSLHFGQYSISISNDLLDDLSPVQNVKDLGSLREVCEEQERCSSHERQVSPDEAQVYHLDYEVGTCLEKGFCLKVYVKKLLRDI